MRKVTNKRGIYWSDKKAVDLLRLPKLDVCILVIIGLLWLKLKKYERHLPL